MVGSCFNSTHRHVLASSGLWEISSNVASCLGFHKENLTRKLGKGKEMVTAYFLISLYREKWMQDCRGENEADRHMPPLLP